MFWNFVLRVQMTARNPSVSSTIRHKLFRRLVLKSSNPVATFAQKQSLQRPVDHGWYCRRNGAHCQRRYQHPANGRGAEAWVTARSLQLSLDASVRPTAGTYRDAELRSVCATAARQRSHRWSLSTNRIEGLWGNARSMLACVKNLTPHGFPVF